MYCDPIFICTSCFLKIHVYFIHLNWKHLKGLKFISWCFILDHLKYVFSSKLGRYSSLMVLLFSLCLSFLSSYIMILKNDAPQIWNQSPFIY
jgi:hypothetical protein